MRSAISCFRSSDTGEFWYEARTSFGTWYRPLIETFQQPVFSYGFAAVRIPWPAHPAKARTHASEPHRKIV